MNSRCLIVFAGFVGRLSRYSTAPARADTQAVYHGGTYFGSVVVEPGQVVDGDLTVIFGDATIAGIVEGDVNVVGGSYDPRPGGVVTGQVNQVGGAVTQAVVPWAPSESAYGPFVPDHRLLWRLSWNLLALLDLLDLSPADAHGARPSGAPSRAFALPPGCWAVSR